MYMYMYIKIKCPTSNPYMSNKPWLLILYHYMSSGKYYMHIQDENQFNNIKTQYRNKDMRNVTRATTFTITRKVVKA